MAKATTQGSQGPRDPEQIERDIEETREELAGTVGAVADKANVKKQAKAKVEDAKSSAREKVEDVKAGAEAKREDLSAEAQGVTPEQVQSAGRSALEKARENPVPVAIAGAVAAGFALAWLVRR